MRKLLTVTLLACAVSAVAAQQPALKSGLDLSTFDKSVRPQDDLFRHVNGTWLKNTEIPADRPLTGTFVQLADKSEADLYSLIEELSGNPNRKAGTVAQQVGDLFISFTDEKRINALGAEPLKPTLARIDAITTPAELARVIGELSIIGLPGPVGGFIDADAGDPTKVALYLFQGGTTLPDRDYYLLDDPKFVEIRAKYVEYLEKTFTMAGRPDAAAAAKAVMGLETELAKIQWTQVESRDAVKTYNKVATAKLPSDMPGFDWIGWATAQGIEKTPEVIISQPSFFKGFAAMVPTVPMGTWKSWLAAQYITTAGPYLSQPFVDARFEFFGKTMSGQQAQRPRWKRGVQAVNGSLGEALGQLYVQKYFPPKAKARMETMIANLIEAYRVSINELDWMTPATKKEALEKLSRFKAKIAYPNRWRDYSALTIKSEDLLGNMERAARVEHEYQIGKLKKPVDHEEWLMSPQTVNAYYNPVKNEIVFPAAILQAPFFDFEADDAVNYGAIGAVIGHEIGHGFDDQGRRFDGTGALRDWWTPADEAEFQKRTKLLVDQFSVLSPAAGLTVNGELTLGENIGDLGGLSIAYKAWKLSLKGKPSPVIDGFTGDQRVFMGWAQAWRTKAREQYLRQMVMSDPHAPAEFRANAPLGNIPGFYEAFGVKPGDKLYREPAKRVKIW
jgi:putative endopeptidase